MQTFERNPVNAGRPHELIADETDSESSFTQCDVTSEDDLVTAVAEAENFGSLNIVANNAVIGRIDDYDADTATFNEFFATNARGYFMAARTTAERMDEGSIIDIASVEALEGGRSVPSTARRGVPSDN